MIYASTVKIKRGKLLLEIDPAGCRIDIYYDGAKMTKEHGFISIIGADSGKRYYSDKAAWSLRKNSPKDLSIELRWDGLKAVQAWRISLPEAGRIDWRLSLDTAQGQGVCEQEAGLLLSDAYKEWFSAAEGGVFPLIGEQDKEWKDIKLKDDTNIKMIGARAGSGGVSPLPLPAVAIDYSANPWRTCAQVRNSGFFSGLRGLLVFFQVASRDGGDEQKSINRDFKCRINIFGNSFKLSRYINSRRRSYEDRAFLMAFENMRPSAGYRAVLRYLILRLDEHCRKGGFFYALLRLTGYMAYQIRMIDLSVLSYDLKPPKQKRTPQLPEKIFIEKEGLKVEFEDASRSCNIFWNGRKLTQQPGLVTAMGERSVFLRRHYSNVGFWKPEKLDYNKAQITFDKFNFPLKQRWVIEIIDGNNITWDVYILPKRRVNLMEKEAGVLLLKDYTHWMNSCEEGEFPQIRPSDTQWSQIKLWNLDSSCVGAWGDRENLSELPALVYEFEARSANPAKPAIKNSDHTANSRALFAQMNDFVKNVYPAGKEHHILSARIRLMGSRDKLSEYTSSCRKKLLDQPINWQAFRSLDRQMGYLSDILKPVEVVLVNMPWKKGQLCGVRAGSRWPHLKSSDEKYLPFPFFLAYSAALMKREGIPVRIVDAIAEEMGADEFVPFVKGLGPRLLIAEVSTPSLNNDMRILRELKGKGTAVAVCGLDYNIRNPDFLKQHSFIDFVMYGEYEYTALELYRALEKGSSLADIPGLIFRSAEKLQVNPPRGINHDLDSLPWPLREQLPMHKYLDAPGNIPLPSVQMLASRGCPFSCIFCAWPQLMYNGKHYRMRSARDIVDEMEHLINAKKFKSVYFDDDTFNVNKRSVMDICSEIKLRKLDIPWAIMARADMMDREMLIAMKEAGLRSLKYGVETADQSLLDACGKGMSLKKADEIIRMTKSLGIKIHLTFTFGIPGETKGTIEKTIDYALSLNPDTVQFSIMTPYPGTVLYKQLQEKGHILSDDWSEYDGARRSVIRTDDLSSRDLEDAKEEALRRWKDLCRKRRSVFLMPFDRELRAAFGNSLKEKGFKQTLLKTAKYVFQG